MANENRRKLYNAMQSAGYDIGDYDEFDRRMNNAQDRRKFYDAVQEAGYDIGGYGDFVERIKDSKYNLIVNGNRQAVSERQYKDFVARRGQGRKPAALSPEERQAMARHTQQVQAPQFAQQAETAESTRVAKPVVQPQRRNNNIIRQKQNPLPEGFGELSPNLIPSAIMSEEEQEARRIEDYGNNVPQIARTEDTINSINGKGTPKGRERLRKMAQQMKDRADYARLTGGDELKDEVLDLTPIGITPTLARDEEGNPLVNDDGTPIVGIESDRVKANTQGYMQQQTYKEDLARNIQQNQEELAKLQDELKELKQNQAPKVLSPLDLSLDDGSGMFSSDTDISAMTTAIRMKQETIERLQDALDRSNRSFWHGVGTEVWNENNFLFGIEGALDNMTLERVKMKIENGEQISLAERALLETSMASDKAKSIEQQTASDFYNYGKTAGKAVHLVKDFLLGGKIIKSLMGGGAALGVGIADALGANGVSRILLKGLGIGMGDLAAGFGMATTIQSAETASRIMEKNLGNVTQDEEGNFKFEGGKDALRATFEGIVENTIEQATEAGGVNEALGGLVSRALGKRGLSWVSRAVNNLTTNKFLRSARIQSLPEEILEEYEGQIAQGLLVDSEQLKELGDAKTHRDIILGTVFSMGVLQAPHFAHKAIEKGYNATQYYRYKRKVDKADRAAFDVLEDKWESLRGRIDETTNDEMAALADEIANSDQYSDLEKVYISRYIYNLTFMRGYNSSELNNAKGIAKGEEDVTDEEEADDTEQLLASEDAGYNATEAEEKQRIKNLLQLRMQTSSEVLGEDTVEMLDDNPIPTLLRLRERGEEAEIRAALDYVNAKYAYEGMIERVQDDIDVAQQQADYRIRRRTNFTTLGEPTIIPVITQQGKRMYITDGEVSALEDGSIDLQNSNDDLIAVDEEGNVSFLYAKDIKTVEEQIDPAHALEETRNNIAQELSKKEADEIDGVLPFNPNDVYQGADEQGIIRNVTVLQDNGENVTVSIDGSQPIVYPKQTIQSWVDAGRMANLQQEEAERLASYEPVEEYDYEGSADMEGYEPVEDYSEEYGNVGNNGSEYEYEQPFEGVTPEEAQAEAEQYQANRPAMEKIPVVVDENNQPVLNKKGRPQYLWTQAPVETTADALSELNDGILVDARDTAQNMKKAADERLQKVKAQKVKGDDPIEEAESRKEIRNQVQAAQAEVDYWKNVTQEINKRMSAESARLQAEAEAWKTAEQKERERVEREKAEQERIAREREAIRKEIEKDSKKRNEPYKPLVDAQKEMADDAEAMAILQDTEPRDLAEWVSSLIRLHSMMWQDEDGQRGLQSELGLKRSDIQKFISLLAQRENGGKPFAEVVDEIYAELPEAMKQQYTDQDVRNTLLDLFNEGSVARMRNLAEEHRIEEARAQYDYNRRREEEAELQAWADAFHLSPEERESFEAWMEDDTPIPMSDEELAHIINIIEQENEQSGESQEVGNEAVTRAEDTGNNELPSEQPRAETTEQSAEGSEDNAVEGENEPDDIDKPLGNLKEVKEFLKSIGYNGSLSKVVTDKDGKKAVRYQADGVITPIIVFGETTRKDVYRQFHLYRNIMDVNIPVDLEAEFEREQAERKRISDALYADDREQIKNILAKEGIPFHDVIDSERGSRIVFTDVRNENGNYTDWMDVSDPDQVTEDIDFIRERAKRNQPTQEQEPTATSGNGYTITPTKYTTKRGKELDMQLVTFDNELTKEQKRAADKLAREKKGWYDRNSGGYMMRSKEDAEELAKLIGNDEAVQEAQPISLADIQGVTDEAEDEERYAKRIEVVDLPTWETTETPYGTEYHERVIVDGKHNVLKVDAPNEKGDYTGSYYIYDNKRFGDIREVIDYIDSKPQEIARAEQETDTNPTDKQKEAGNYKKGHVKIDGYDITIENPKGSKRSGTDKNGNKWEVTMNNTYGYIRGTEGVDGDHVDVFLSDNPTQGIVYVVDQVKEDGSFDEHKVMYGFNSEQEAREAYLANYSKGWKGLGTITGVSKDEFKKWINSSHRKTKPFADYKSVNTEQPQASANETQQQEQQKEQQKPPKSKYVSDDDAERFAELKRRLRQKLLGQMNMGIDPEIFTLGVEMTYMIVKNQARKFADYARAMIEEMGDAIRPYLKAFYNGARELPELEDIADELTPYEEVRTFDVANFDKEGAKDLIKTAEVVAKEDEANNQAETAKEKITQGRNERQEKENEIKRTAAHFAEETQEEATAFDKRVPEMDDAELLAYMQEDGMGDVNKAHHPSVYDEYDYRHGDEQMQSYDDTLVRLNESGTTLKQAEEKLANIQKDVSRLATEDRAMLLGQEEALQEYIAGLEKIHYDRQGNPVDADGNLILEEISSVDELKGKDFSSPTRNVQLPKIPDAVDKAIGANGKPVIIKKNIFEKNKANHPELKPSQSRKILKDALYSTNLYGQTQPKSRSNYWVVIRSSDPNRVVVLEVSENKDNVEIVGWRYAGERQLEELRKQAEREDGQLLILTSEKEAAAGLSTLPSGVSAGKVTDLFGNAQGSGKKSSSDGKIDDVGEVLAGARKDMRREIAKSLANVTEAALVEKPFGKVYKKPDLKKAVESGALREKDAIFYEALFSMVNQQKPKVTQSEMRSKRYIPDRKTKAERWAADTFKQMEVLRQFMELDEPGRDAMMERMLADRYPTREQELAEIEKRKGWNPDYEGHKYEWGEMTTPNPLWVTHEVMNRLGYSVGEKLDVPYGVVKANTSGTGYSIENLKGERAILFGSGMTLDEAIDRIVYLAKLKRGDADVSHPTQLFAFPATKSESGESGRYRVMWGRDYKTREFDSREDADAFAQTKSGAYVSPIMETKRRFGYKVRFTHPLTGEKMFVDDAEFDTKEEAQAYFDGNFEKLNEATNAKLQEEREKKGEKKTLTADDVVHVTMVHSGKGGWTHAVVIDKKYANNDGQVRIIKEGFASWKDAKSFADSVKDDVLKTVLKHKEEAKKIVYFDTGDNSRIGEDYRNGKDVDAEDFMNTFGFRGVQFGNWTNQADRQMAVNQAYDAFMDMARLIGVSPKAMSLNGELGIAFGARGVGGFAAHYEPGEVVINLTKTQGAGSLAHEWWHALDNYFARRAGSAGDMVTDNRRIDMRDALRKAFNDMLDMVNGSDYALRSADKGEYWGRTHEITARLLAEWVDKELKKRGELNTFLSRGAVVERGQQHNYNVYEVLERLAGREPMPFEDYMELPESLKGIPYPSAKEVEQFGGSLRHIFDTLEEQVDEETGNTILFRGMDDTLPFYSNAARAVEQVKQDKATPEQWLKMIEKNGGLKSGEDKWIGLSDWLKASKAKSLTKQEVMDYIRQNQIQIEETEYADKTLGRYDEHWDYLRTWLEENTDNPDAWYNTITEYYGYRDGEGFFLNQGARMPKQVTDMVDRINKSIDKSNPINSTRLTYTTQGLDNKREIALTVPTIESWNTQDEIHFGDAGQGRAVAWVRFGEATIEAPAEGLDKSKYTAKQSKQGGFDVHRPNGSEWGRIGAATAEQAIDEAYQDDVLRNKTTQRVLVIDEIQSKRHQEGREKGYKPQVSAEKKEAYEKARELSRKAVRDMREYRKALSEKYGNPADYSRPEDLFLPGDRGMERWKAALTEDERAEYERLESQMKDASNVVLSLEEEMATSAFDTRIPSAPFEKNWHELAMKRMLRYAAENGFDKVAWTTGEQQAERYDIGTAIESIKVGKVYDQRRGMREIVISKTNGYKDVLNMNKDGIIKDALGEWSFANGKSVEEVFGKELGGKIRNSQPDNVIEGHGLRIGGEGMKGFYDEILPRFMNKYGKKWGAKVGTVELPELMKKERWGLPALKMWAVDVTPEMKDSVMQGQPMFRQTQQGSAQRTTMQAIREAVNDIIDKLHIADRVTILETTEGLKGKRARAKGWYDVSTGKIVIVLPNNRNAADAMRTILHEAVAHMGLRELFGKEFNNFLMDVYSNASESIRRKINANAAKKGWDIREATEEYLASLAETQDFEQARKQGIWNKVKEWFNNLLSKVGIPKLFTTSYDDNELRYILWRSWRNLAEGGNRDYLGMAEDIVKREELGIGDTRYSMRRFGGNSGYVGYSKSKRAVDAENRGLRSKSQMDKSFADEVNEIIRERFPDFKGVSLKEIKNALPVISADEWHHTSMYGNRTDYYSAETVADYFMPETEEEKQRKEELERLRNEVRALWDEIRNEVYDRVPSEKIDKPYSSGRYFKTSDGNFVWHNSNDVLGKTTRRNMRFIPKGEDFEVEYWDEQAYEYGEVMDKAAEEYNAAKKAAIDSIPQEKKDRLSELSRRIAALERGGIDTGELMRDGDDIRFREDDEIGPTSDVARTVYDSVMSDRKKHVQEAWQDGMISIKEAQDAVLDTDDKPLRSYEDAYQFENHMHGISRNEAEYFERNLFKPLLKAIDALAKKSGKTANDVYRYLMLKHGLERNKVFAERDARREHEAEMAKLQSMLEDSTLTDEQKAAIEKRIRLEEAKFDGLVNHIADPDIKAYYDQQLRTIGTLRANGQISEEEYNKRMAALTSLYLHGNKDSYKWKDYSGLMAVTGAETLEEAERLANEEINDMEGLASEETRELWKAVNAATQWTLRKSFDSGEMTRDNYEAVKSMFDYYVPLRGWAETRASDVYDYMGGKGEAFSPVVRKAFGRMSEADNPIAYIGNMAVSAIVGGNKNLLKQHLLRFAQNHPSTLFTVSEQWYQNVGTEENPKWTAVSPDIPEGATAEQIDAAIRQFDEDMKALEESGMATRKKGRLKINYPEDNARLKEHQVRVRVNGREYVIYVNGNPREAQAINGKLRTRARENSYESSKMANINRAMAQNFTSRNPAFIFSNASCDLTMSMAVVGIKESAAYNKKFYATLGRVVFRPRAVREGAMMPMLMGMYLDNKIDDFIADTSNDKDLRTFAKYFKEFMTNGGETGFTSLRDVDTFKRTMQKEYGRMNQGKADPRKMLRKMGEGFEYMNRCVEDMTRFVTFATSRQMGRSIADSVTDAKNVTLNFNRKGSGAMGNATFRNFYIFVNPAIQALHLLWQLASDKRTRKAFTVTTLSFATAGALMPIVNAAIYALTGGGDDDDYWNLPTWVRRNNICFKIPHTGSFITIPLAQEFRVFYGLGELVASALLGHPDKNAALSATEQVTDLLPISFTGAGGNLAVNLAPTLLQPLMQVNSNVDFTGKPIRKMTPFNENEPAFQKAYRGTPSWMVKSSELINDLTGGNEHFKGWIEGELATTLYLNYANDPAVVNHILKGYFGGMYSFISGTTGLATTALSGEMPKSYEVPILNRFINIPLERTERGSIVLGEEYYGIKKEMQKYQDEVRGFERDAKKGDTDARKIAEEMRGSDKYKHYKLTSALINKIEDVRNKVKYIPSESARENANIVMGELYDKLRKVDALTDKEAARLTQIEDNGELNEIYALPIDEMKKRLNE